MKQDRLAACSLQHLDLLADQGKETKHKIKSSARLTQEFHLPLLPLTHRLPQTAAGLDFGEEVYTENVGTGCRS